MLTGKATHGHNLICVTITKFRIEEWPEKNAVKNDEIRQERYQNNMQEEVQAESDRQYARMKSEQTDSTRDTRKEMRSIKEFR